MSKLSDLRKSYELGELDETQVADRPLAQFKLWLEQALAAELPEPNAMTLATVGADGRPSTRFLAPDQGEPLAVAAATARKR